MMNTSTIKQQQDLISILTTQLEKEKARLKKLQSVETKISKTLETLLPILTEYPEYKNSIAEKLGLTLPPPTQLRVIEITDGEETNNHQIIEKPQPENNPTPTITIKENSTKVSSNQPSGKVDNETESNNSSESNNTPTHPESNNSSESNNTPTHPESNNSSESNNTPTHPDSDTPVEKLEELAKVGLQHNLTININTQQLTGEVLAPHPKTEKLHPVVTFNLSNLELSQGWLWQYNINIDSDNYHNICYTGTPTDFIQVLTRCAKYYFEKPVNNLITKVTEDFPLNWKHNKITNRWTKILTEKESKQLTQNTNNPTGIIQLHTGFHQWNFNRESQILTLKENNKDTTSDNNAETDFTHIEKSGDAPTPPTSDTVNDKNTPNQPTVTWYNSNSGAVETVKETEESSTTTGTSNDADNFDYSDEVDTSYSEQNQENIHAVNSAIEKLPIVEEGDKNIILWYDNNNGEITINQEKRYFQILWNSRKNQYQVGLKKSLSSQKWRKDKNPTAQKFVDAIMQEFKEYKPNATNTKAEETTENQGKTSDCWYTPPSVIKPVIEVLETINIDPCSDNGKHIPATTHYTITEDGLNQQWLGKVFINPPYSCPSKWVEKLLSEINNCRVTEAIALLPASTDTKWFKPLWNQPICFWKGRIKFLDINYQPKSPARQSHCLVYWGENIEKFNEIFGKFGEVVLPKEESQNIESEPKEKAEKTLTFSQKIQPYLPPTWILEEHLFDQVIIKEKNRQNNHVKLCNSTMGDIYIKHNQELLYTVNYQDIETAIDLISCWFEQQESVKIPSINDQNSNNNSGKNNESAVANTSPKEDKKLPTLAEQIKPYLPKKWIIEEHSFDKVILQEKHHKNNHVQLIDCLNGDIRITHDIELLYIVQSQEIETAIDLIYSWFEQQKTVKSPSINDQNSNNNSGKNNESAVAIKSPEKDKKLPTLAEKIQQYLPPTWILENNFFDQVTIRENTHINSNYVKLTDCLNGEINIHHKKELLYTVESQNIEVAIDLIYWWFNQAKTSNKLDKFIEIINNYDTDLTIEKKDSSTAYINCGQKTLGTIFYNDNQTLELPEREKQILEKSYSIYSEELIDNINNESCDENPNIYLLGIGKLDEELTPRDTLQNALYSLSSRFIWNELSLEVIRIGKTFRIYSGSDWLENYLGAITVSGSEIVCDEDLVATLLDKFSILLEQLIQDILNDEKEIDEQKYILNDILVRELLLKKGWDEKDFNQAHQLLLNNDNNPTWRQILHSHCQEQEDLFGINLETIRQQNHILIDSKNPEENDDNKSNNGDSTTTPSAPKQTNNNSSNKAESRVASESPKKDKKLPTLAEQIKPILSETWLLKTINNNEVILYETKDKNSDFVQITKTSDNSTPFRLTHKGESYFTDNIADIKFALVSDNFTDINWDILSAKDGCNSVKSTEIFKPKEEVDTDISEVDIDSSELDTDSSEVDIDYLDILIEIINNYDTDLTIQRKDTSTAYIKIRRKTVGNIFVKDDQTIEIAEREKQLLTESYSIDLDILIQDIYQKKVDKNKNNYLMGVGSLDTELNYLDTLQNALHCLSNQLNLVTIRQGKTFKIYNGKGWLEHYLGSIVVNKSEITCDEHLSYELLNNHSILLNQLTIDIVKGETKIETDNYIITNAILKELLTKENWDNWNEQDFETAQNLLKELVDFSPTWNQLLETLRQQRKELIERTINNDDDNDTNNGGSKTPPSTPKNPNNNGGEIKTKTESNKEYLDTLETAINSYKTDLKMKKNHSNIAFHQGHSQLGSVTINQGKLLAETKLVSHLTLFYGIDIKGLIKSIKYKSKYPGHELDLFAYIDSNNNAFKPLGCVVAPTWEKERERRGILQSVSGEIATIQWLDSGVPGDNSIGYVNINLLRYVSALPLTNTEEESTSDVQSNARRSDRHTETESTVLTLSDKPTAESIASLNFGGLIAVPSTQKLSTVKATQLNTEEPPETESIINTRNNTVIEDLEDGESSETTFSSEHDNDEPTAESKGTLDFCSAIAAPNTQPPSTVVEVNHTALNNERSNTITWYTSYSGEVTVDKEHRYFHVFFDNKKNEYYIGVKKSETAKSWSKNTNATQKFIDAVWKHLKENPSEKDKGGIVQELQNAAAQLGAKFVNYTGYEICSRLGWFFIGDLKIADVGYQKNSWWYSRPGDEKTYYSGDATAFVQVLKDLATEESTSNDTTNNQTESESNESTAKSMAVLKVNHTPSEQRKTGKTLTINSQNLTINGKAISFGQTLTELLSGNKTVTRRLWKDSYAKRFIDDWNAKPGKFLYPALTKSYRVGGKRVGYVRLTHKPYQEKLVDMPSSELVAEGFPKLSKQQFINRFFDGNEQQEAWVIRFEFISNTPNKKKPELLSEQKNNQTILKEKLIDKVEQQLSILDKFSFQRTLGIPKITLHISLKDEILGKIFTDTHEGLVSDISLEKSLMERYGLDIKSLILDVVNGKQLQIENYCKHPENHTTTKGDTEIIENTADDFFDKYDDPMWLNLIKAEIEFLEDFKASHDEVDLTVTHYGTYIGSIHHNQDDELEVEQKLIGELAKYDCDLEAFLVAENIPYQLYYPKPVVVIPTQTSEHTKKSIPDKSNGSKTDSNILNKNKSKLDTVYIQEPCTITKIRQILATVAPEICFTDDGINMVAWRDGKDLGSINVPGLPLWITYCCDLEEYLKNHCGFNLSSFVGDIEKGNLNGLPFSDLMEELKNGNKNCKYFDSDKKNNLPTTSPSQANTKDLDLLDKLTAVFEGFDNIRTKRSETTLWFYRGSDNLYPCLMLTRDGETFTLFPTVKFKSNMKELFGIDIDQVCDDLEAGKSIDINDYVDNSIWEQTIKNSHKNNETITWSDILNNTDLNETTDSQTKNELNTSTTTEESDADSYEHPEGLHWLKDTSIYNRSETYVVWNGTQKCGKIHICNKSKNKAGFGKWYISPNVFGPYYDTIEKAATACWQDFISKKATPTEAEEDLIPF